MAHHKKTALLQKWQPHFSGILQRRSPACAGQQAFVRIGLQQHHATLAARKIVQYMVAAWFSETHLLAQAGGLVGVGLRQRRRALAAAWPRQRRRLSRRWRLRINVLNCRPRTLKQPRLGILAQVIVRLNATVSLLLRRSQSKAIKSQVFPHLRRRPLRTACSASRLQQRQQWRAAAGLRRQLRQHLSR